MPLYMDTHSHLEGTAAEEVLEAHRNLELQKKHRVKFLRSWREEVDGRVFCLMEAPSKEAAQAIHRDVPGLAAGDIVELKKEWRLRAKRRSWRARYSS